LACHRALLWILRLEHAALVVLASEIAHDRIRLPQKEAILLLERRYEAIWIHRKIRCFLVLAERAADINALMLNLELADRPHRLLHIRRCIAAPDFDHSILSLTRVLMSSPGQARR
jgi:hypothetical protein